MVCVFLCFFLGLVFYGLFVLYVCVKGVYGFEYKICLCVGVWYYFVYVKGVLAYTRDASYYVYSVNVVMCIMQVVYSVVYMLRGVGYNMYRYTSFEYEIRAWCI